MFKYRLFILIVGSSIMCGKNARHLNDSPITLSNKSLQITNASQWLAGLLKNTLPVYLTKPDTSLADDIYNTLIAYGQACHVMPIRFLHVFCNACTLACTQTTRDTVNLTYGSIILSAVCIASWLPSTSATNLQALSPSTQNPCILKISCGLSGEYSFQLTSMTWEVLHKPPLRIDTSSTAPEINAFCNTVYSQIQDEPNYSGSAQNKEQACPQSAEFQATYAANPAPDSAACAADDTDKPASNASSAAYAGAPAPDSAPCPPDDTDQPALSSATSSAACAASSHHDIHTQPDTKRSKPDTSERQIKTDKAIEALQTILSKLFNAPLNISLQELEQNSRQSIYTPTCPEYYLFERIIGTWMLSKVEGALFSARVKFNKIKSITDAFSQSQLEGAPFSIITDAFSQSQLEGTPFSTIFKALCNIWVSCGTQRPFLNSGGTIATSIIAGGITVVHQSNEHKPSSEQSAVITVACTPYEISNQTYNLQISSITLERLDKEPLVLNQANVSSASHDFCTAIHSTIQENAFDQWIFNLRDLMRTLEEIKITSKCRLNFEYLLAEAEDLYLSTHQEFALAFLSVLDPKNSSTPSQMYPIVQKFFEKSKTQDFDTFKADMREQWATYTASVQKTPKSTISQAVSINATNPESASAACAASRGATWTLDDAINAMSAVLDGRFNAQALSTDDPYYQLYGLFQVLSRVIYKLKHKRRVQFPITYGAIQICDPDIKPTKGYNLTVALQPRCVSLTAYVGKSSYILRSTSIPQYRNFAYYLKQLIQESAARAASQAAQLGKSSPTPDQQCNIINFLSYAMQQLISTGKLPDISAGRSRSDLLCHILENVAYCACNPGIPPIEYPKDPVSSTEGSKDWSKGLVISQADSYDCGMHICVQACSETRRIKALVLQSGHIVLNALTDPEKFLAQLDTLCIQHRVPLPTVPSPSHGIQYQ